MLMLLYVAHNLYTHTISNIYTHTCMPEVIKEIISNQPFNYVGIHYPDKYKKTT